MPLLLSLAAPSLSILLPNPLPPNAPQFVVDSKYPFANLRKQLRLLIEDPDPMEELENDISYVYSGYAPISVRLVQCVAQKGGVLSNPAGEKDKRIAAGDAKGKNVAGAAAGAGGGADADGDAPPKVQAHPIMGWKGFEDVVASIPGETVDIVQRAPGSTEGAAAPAIANLGEWAVSLGCSCYACSWCEFARQCCPRSRRLRRWCSSWADALTRRLPRCGGWAGRTRVCCPFLRL